jgi:hypothetical protein
MQRPSRVLKRWGSAFMQVVDLWVTSYTAVMQMNGNVVAKLVADM